MAKAAGMADEFERGGVDAMGDVGANEPVERGGVKVASQESDEAVHFLTGDDDAGCWGHGGVGRGVAM